MVPEAAHAARGREWPAAGKGRPHLDFDRLDPFGRWTWSHLERQPAGSTPEEGQGSTDHRSNAGGPQPPRPSTVIVRLFEEMPASYLPRTFESSESTDQSCVKDARVFIDNHPVPMRTEMARSPGSGHRAMVAARFRLFRRKTSQSSRLSRRSTTVPSTPAAPGFITRDDRGPVGRPSSGPRES
jgi:hypothetical protein